MPKLEVEGVDILNEASVVAIIRYLYRNQKALSTELKAVSGSYDRLKLLTERMEEMGIIKTEKTEKPRKTIESKLTKKGMMLAEKLEELDGLIRST